MFVIDVVTLLHLFSILNYICPLALGHNCIETESVVITLLLLPFLLLSLLLSSRLRVGNTCIVSLDYRFIENSSWVQEVSTLQAIQMRDDARQNNFKTPTRRSSIVLYNFIHRLNILCGISAIYLVSLKFTVLRITGPKSDVILLQHHSRDNRDFCG